MTERDKRRQFHRETVEGLDEAERALLIAQCQRWLDPPNVVPRPSWLIQWCLLTGVHVDVLAHPRTSFLTVDLAANRVRWDRSKTQTHMDLALNPLLRPFAVPFVASLTEPETHRFVTQRYTVTQTVHVPHPTRAGVTVEVEEEVIKTRQADVCDSRLSQLVQRTLKKLGWTNRSARSLRHSFALMTARNSNNNLDVICQDLGCTAEVARDYIQKDRDARREYDAKVLAGAVR
jgi:integrase